MTSKRTNVSQKSADCAAETNPIFKKIKLTQTIFKPSNEELRQAIKYFNDNDYEKGVEKYGFPDNWNTSQVTNMKGLFNHSKLIIDVSRWDTSNVTDMSWMFWGTQFTGNFNDYDYQDLLLNWNTSNVTNMEGMFADSNFNGNINTEMYGGEYHWDTSKVTNMGSMFEESKFNRDISNWDVGKVTNMSEMFKKSDFNNKSVLRWDVSKVANFNHMFYNSKFRYYDEILSSWRINDSSEYEDMVSYDYEKYVSEKEEEYTTEEEEVE